MSDIDVSCLICDDVRQEANGKHILIGVYNDAIIFQTQDWESQDQQVGLPKLVFALFISGIEEGTKDVAWSIDDPAGEAFGPQEPQSAPFDFKQGETHTLNVQVTQIMFTRIGEYRFRLRIGADFEYVKVFRIRLQ